ncbi:serine/threonine-protein kinase [Nocardia bovistercoris]|uniref:serine/threonine-protein kinase n=1 Tax=Nocardia bovistercoris TaxID=2785916 RepID=UPI002FCD0109
MDGPGWRVGSRFGPYELRALLGRGGMGEVYEAYDTVENRVVAVKLLPGRYADDPAYRERLGRETRSVALLGSPHIVPVNGWGVIDGALFIDMLLVPGGDLRAILRTQGPITAERTMKIVDQIAAALDAAHAEGLVHRDVKPANILVTEADFAYLADFGVVHTEGDAAVATNGAVSSYIYTAPERFADGAVTGFADVYSLTCVLHECLTGTTPFPASSINGLIRAHRSEPPPRPSQRRPGLSPAVDEVIARGMAKNPAERYATAAALAQAARIALAAAPAPTGPTFVVRTPDPSRFGQTESVAPASSLIPPEATGEFSIIPTAATAVDLTEIQFAPLPSARQEPAAPVPMRPFPDAHLYPEDQRYGEAETSAPDPQWSPSISGPYPPAPSGPLDAVAPPTRKYGAAVPEPQPPVAPTISRAPSEPAPRTARYGAAAAPDMNRRFEPVAAPLDAYASGPRGHEEPQGYGTGSPSYAGDPEGYDDPQDYRGESQRYTAGTDGYDSSPDYAARAPESFDTGAQGFASESQGYAAATRGYGAESQGYDAQAYSAGPHGYAGADGPVAQGFDADEQGFSNESRGYDAQAYSTGPGGYAGGGADASEVHGFAGARDFSNQPHDHAAATREYRSEPQGFDARSHEYPGEPQSYSAGAPGFGGGSHGDDSGALGYDAVGRQGARGGSGFDSGARDHGEAARHGDLNSPAYGGPGNRDAGTGDYDATVLRQDVSSPERAWEGDAAARDYDATVLRGVASPQGHDGAAWYNDAGGPGYAAGAPEYDTTLLPGNPQAPAYDSGARGFDGHGRREDVGGYGGAPVAGGESGYETTVLRGDAAAPGFDSGAAGYDATVRRGDPGSREYDPTVLRHDVAPQEYPAPEGGYAAETRSYDEPGYQAPGAYPDAAGFAGAQAYSDYRPEQHPGAPYGPEGYGGQGEYEYEQGPYTDDYPDAPYRQESRRRSIAAPLLITAAVIVVLAVAGAIGWTMLRSTPDTDVQDQAGPAATAVAPRGTTPGGAAPSAPSSTSASSTSTAALPAGAKTCSTGRPVPGSFTQSATGSEVTSCPFAEAVRQAYAESAAATSSRAPRSVVAVSPVTGRSYTMNCVAEGQVVICSGGENAVVYIY